MPSTATHSLPVHAMIESPQRLSSLSQLTADEQLNAAACFGRLDSQELLQGQKSVTIMHNGTQYRLQATKLGKLILTK